MGDNQDQQGMGGDARAGGLDLRPGFQFHPSNEDIISFYLKPKVLHRNFTTVAIGEANLNKSEPWDLPSQVKMGEKHWYFYYLKVRKYSSGLRTNRAMEAGYWKATGKDMEIYRATAMAPTLIGMKKTLVFYIGRAPNGEKTNWVMHEFRINDSSRLPCPTTSSSSTTTEEWVVCKMFHKRSEIKKASVLAPPIHKYDATGDVEQRSLSFPIPMQFPMGQEDFVIDSNALLPLVDATESFYSTVGTSSLVPPIAGAQMNTGLFVNPMEAASNDGFIAGPDSIPMPIMPKHVGMSLHQNNMSSATMDMYDIWKF